ncbi:hypothetical protein ACFYO2_15640 [Streptomyces sp. NPDC006602]
MTSPEFSYGYAHGDGPELAPADGRLRPGLARPTGIAHLCSPQQGFRTGD